MIILLKRSTALTMTGKIKTNDKVSISNREVKSRKVGIKEMNKSEAYYKANIV